MHLKRKENARLQRRLLKPELMLDALGNVHALLQRLQARARGTSSRRRSPDVLAATVGTRAACRLLAMPRATVHRHRKPVNEKPRRTRRRLDASVALNVNRFSTPRTATVSPT